MSRSSGIQIRSSFFAQPPLGAQVQRRAAAAGHVGLDRVRDERVPV